MATKRSPSTPSTPRKAPPRLTAARVDTLGAGDYTDSAAIGLQLRVRAKRAGVSRTWLLRYRWRGEWVRITLGHRPGMTLTQARETARGLRGKLDAGVDPRRARPTRSTKANALPVSAAVTGAASHSVEFLASQFMQQHVRPTRKRPEYAAAILERDVLSAWKGRDARTIEPREVIELLDVIVDRGSRVMANRTAALLSQMFRFGIHREIVRASPVQLLYRPGGPERPRERTLTDEELAAFLHDPLAATRHARLAHVMQILLLTAQRRGALAAARWSEIDYTAATWTIPPGNSNTGRGHVVPLSAPAVREFGALQRLAKHSKWVLPASSGDGPVDPLRLTRGIARCQPRFARLGIAPFVLHDLRRTCRAGLARLGVAPHIVERVLGRAQQKIPGTCDTHDYLDEQRAALEQWATHLECLAQPRLPQPVAERPPRKRAA